MKAETEANILAACLKLLEYRGWLHWRNNTGAVTIKGQFMRFGKVGSSDILAVVPGTGRFLAIECKRPGCKPTMAQERFLKAVRDNGAHGVVVTDVGDLATILAELEGPDSWR